MRIKRIEITGFKSFCDRSVVNFSAPIVGIVGPNGCGKSNIVDAIRWCMGEQSAKHLRGQAMGDVIFAGSDTRGPSGLSEVSLTFEDVGFNHETLELLQQTSEIDELPEDDEDFDSDAPFEGDRAEAEPSTEGVNEDETLGLQSVPLASSEPAPMADAPSEELSSVEPSTEEEEEIIDPHAATKEVADVLADKPPAIDFAQYSEVTITRRLFRDGTSQYLLNKVPCRLRDITDFFLGTGVGTKAYSIIEQGRIGMIVSSRAGDRRHIIEEAAGITKFKSKKRAAERKLGQTRQNLLRVTDIVDELEKRLGALRRQAQKAERYRRYKAEVKDIELWSASHKLFENIGATRVFSSELSTNEELLVDERTKVETIDATISAERATLSIEERRLSSLQEELYELENHIKLSENKIEYQRREAAELSERSEHGRKRNPRRH